MPLERNTVRFLDNFSTGVRGAGCIEALIARGYAVVSLRRTGSAAPFARSLCGISADGSSPGFDLRFLESLELEPGTGALRLRGDAARLAAVGAALAAYQAARSSGLFEEVEFFTADDYFFKLRALVRALRPCDHAAMGVFAAAVSDFHVPSGARAEHKIASGMGAASLRLDLAPTPKLLGAVRDWAPRLFAVSFKLETDAAVLERKARAAAAAYGMHCVVANALASRRERVDLYSRDADAPALTILRPHGCAELEPLLVDALIARHEKHGVSLGT